VLVRPERFWDGIALTPSEDDVIEAMRLITPEVERLVLKPIDEGSRTRVPFVKIKGQDEPVTLRSLGDGMNRVFGIALALAKARDGLLMIDEVENGLHYSVQSDIWRMIFEVARKLNVQVFATTHSYDCIKAFEEAARTSDEEGVLIRLAQKGGRTLVGEFDENELGVAVQGQIEVR
jgi:predicted ATPase